MSGLRFTKRSDGIARARVRIEFLAEPATLVTSIVFAYQHDPAEQALQVIERLSKTDITLLVKKLYTERGSYQEFIGEDCDVRVEEAAAARVWQLWPELKGT